MNDHHLMSFVVVADCGSISKAAKKLFITQQALSQQIDLVERECKAKFFVRGSTGVELTSYGKLFYEYAGRVIEERSRMMGDLERLRKDEKSTIKIGVTIGSSSNVVRLIAHVFSKRHPQYLQKIIELHVPDRLNSLCAEEIDVLGYAGSSALYERGLEFRKLADAQLMLMTSADHKLAGKNGISIAELSGMQVHVFDGEYYRAPIERFPNVDFTLYDYPISGSTDKFHLSLLDSCQKGSVFLVVEGDELFDSSIMTYHMTLTPLSDTISLGLAFRPDPPEAVRCFIEFTASTFAGGSV